MIKEFGGKSFEIRPLKRGEIKTLRGKGFNLTNLQQDQADEVIDEVIAIVLPDQVSEVDELPNSAVMDLFKEIVNATYGIGEAAKNS